MREDEISELETMNMTFKEFLSSLRQILVLKSFSYVMCNTIHVLHIINLDYNFWLRKQPNKS